MIARIRRTLVIGMLLGAVLPDVLPAQADPVPPPVRRVNLSGPRFGVTYLSSGIVDTLAAYDVDVAPIITQFGWQFERLLFTGGSGLSAVTEWVVLVGGLEQSAFIPSVSWLVGIRGPRGAEFGVGPNLSAAGSALAIAGGVTTRAGAFNLPINIAVVPSKVGTRVSLLFGFTTRSEPGWSRAAPPPVAVPRRSPPRLPPFPLPGLPIPRCCRA